MTEPPLLPPPDNWDWAKDGTWLFTTHGPDCIHIWAQTRDSEPQLIGTRTPQHAAALAFGLLRAITELAELDAELRLDAQRLIAKLEEDLGEPPGIA